MRALPDEPDKAGGKNASKSSVTMVSAKSPSQMQMLLALFQVMLRRTADDVSRFSSFDNSWWALASCAAASNSLSTPVRSPRSGASAARSRRVTLFVMGLPSPVPNLNASEPLVAA